MTPKSQTQESRIKASNLERWTFMEEILHHLGCIKPCKQDCFHQQDYAYFFRRFPLYSRLGSYLEPVESLAHRNLVLPRSLPGSVKSSKISMDFSGSCSDPQHFTLWWLEMVTSSRDGQVSYWQQHHVIETDLDLLPNQNSLHQDDIAF